MGDRNIPGSKAGSGPWPGYPAKMVKLMSRYPDGATGVALLVIRLTCALAIFPALDRLPLTHSGWWLSAISAAVINLALALGFGTRSAAALLALGLAAVTVAAPAELILLLLPSTGGATTLALLGPGAFSVDARLFGRRVIRLEPRSPDRGSAG